MAIHWLLKCNRHEPGYAETKKEGWSVTHDELARLSPYLTEDLKRFGDFYLDLTLTDGNIDKIKEPPWFLEKLAIFVDAWGKG